MLRGSKEKVSFCNYDRVTKRNVLRLFASRLKLMTHSLGKCNKVPRFTSKTQFLQRKASNVTMARPLLSATPPAQTAGRIGNDFENDLNFGESRTVLLKKYKRATLAEAQAIAQDYGDEAFINADFKLRGEEKVSFCNYDDVSKRNPPKLRASNLELMVHTLGKCNKVSRFTSEAQFLQQKGGSVTAKCTPLPSLPISAGTDYSN